MLQLFPWKWRITLNITCLLFPPTLGVFETAVSNCHIRQNIINFGLFFLFLIFFDENWSFSYYFFSPQFIFSFYIFFMAYFFLVQLGLIQRQPKQAASCKCTKLMPLDGLNSRSTTRCLLDLKINCWADCISSKFIR